jgi:hypothetical protein
MEFIHSVRNAFMTFVTNTAEFFASIENAVLELLHKDIAPVVDIMNACIFLLALAALCTTLFQFKIEKRRDRENYDRELYRDYLKMSLENPELSTVEYDEQDRKACDRYDTYITIMLVAFEELMNARRKERRYWIPVLDGLVRTHEKYIKAILHKNVPAEESIREAYTKKFLDVLDTIFDHIEAERLIAARTTAIKLHSEATVAKEGSLTETHGQGPSPGTPLPKGAETQNSGRVGLMP